MTQTLTPTQSWVTSANEPTCGFPLQNLPYCAFMSAGEQHLGIGIGGSILDLHRLSLAGHLAPLTQAIREACLRPTLNGLMACGPEAWTSLRDALIQCLAKSAPQAQQQALAELLIPIKGARFAAPVEVRDYTDFYASLEHATNVGRLFRPDQPLLPNYRYVPIAYHGRASSLVLSGTPIRRPHGQVKPPASAEPMFRACAQLDYELEVAAYIGQANPLGMHIPTAEAERHIFGFSLMNDWSARDIQAWEYQPLGPFLGKNFGTSLSPWVVTLEALRPFRVPRAARAAGDPQPMAYLDDSALGHDPAIDMNVEVYLSTAAMRQRHLTPQRISSGNLRDLYWSFAQMVAHHTINGCNLNPGDLLGSGTISGTTPGSEGSLLEMTRRGQAPIQLETGETRAFLEDGDEIMLRGFCEREGLPRISLGECRGIVEPALSLPQPQATH